MMRVVRMLAMACVVLTAAQASAQVTGTPTVPTAIVPMAKGGTGAALADPNADRLLFWDALASPGDAEKHREVVESSDILMDGLKVVWAAEKRIDFDN